MASQTQRRSGLCSCDLLVVGPSPFKLLRNLVSPAKLSDKTFVQLVTTLTNHYSPKPSEIVQRFRFHSRQRESGETVAAYVAELRAIAEFCNFKDTLEDMLRDRLVCGVNDATMQKKLLSEPTLTSHSCTGCRDRSSECEGAQVPCRHAHFGQ